MIYLLCHIVTRYKAAACGRFVYVMINTYTVKIIDMIITEIKAEGPSIIDKYSFMNHIIAIPDKFQYLRSALYDLFPLFFFGQD